MASDYVGDPTAIQAPSAAPSPGGSPTVHVPSDGDAANAASVLQDFKVLADYIAWLFSPRARVGQYAEAIVRFKDARLRDRFIVDHYGLPAGEFLEWREFFGKRGDWLFATGADGTVRGTSNLVWDINQTGSGTIGVNPPGISTGINFSDTHPVLSIDIDNAAANISEMLLDDDCHTGIWSVNMLCQLDYNFMPHQVTDCTWVHGVCGQGEHVNTIANGAFLIRPNTPGATWKARTIAGGIQTETDTLVAGTVDAIHHWKIAMLGSGVGDDSTNRVVFLCDGVVKANHTTNIPAAGVKIYPVFGGFSGGATGNQRMLLGPPHWTQITRFATP